MGWTPDEGARRQARLITGVDKLPAGNTAFDIIMTTNAITDNDEALTFASLTEMTGGGYAAKNVDQTIFTHSATDGGYTGTQQVWNFTGAPSAAPTAIVVVGDPGGTPYIHSIDLYTEAAPTANGDIVRFDPTNTQD